MSEVKLTEAEARRRLKTMCSCSAFCIEKTEETGRLCKLKQQREAAGRLALEKEGGE